MLRKTRKFFNRRTWTILTKESIAMTAKVLLFDLGRVLVDFDHERSVQQVAALTGLERTVISKLLFQDGLQWQYERGAVSTDALHAMLQNLARGRQFTVAELAFAASDIFAPIAVMHDLVWKLNARGVRMILVSNTCEAHFDYCFARYPVLQCFQAHVLSYKVKAMKPEPEFYAAALRLAGAPPAECLFIDDLPVNISAAEAAGMRGVVFTGIESLLPAIRHLL
jgi:putative hydrolase of the HAD superfamily